MGSKKSKSVNQLQATISKMEVALNTIANAVVFLGENHQIEWYNSAFTNLIGATSSIIGNNFCELFPLKQAGKALTFDAYPDLKIINREYETTEYEFVKGDRKLNLKISGNFVEVSKHTSSAILVIEDVTPQNKSINQEQEQQEYLSLLKATLESTADGILVVNRSRNAPIYNQKFLQMWGMPEELLFPGKEDERLQFLAQQTKDPEEFVAKIWDLFLNRPEAIVLDLVEFKDGRIFERYSQPQWKDREIIGRVWSFRDITEQKKIEERLRFSQFALDQISDNVACCDQEGKIYYVNQASCRLVGFSREELLGLTVHDLDPNYPKEVWPEHWRELKEKGTLTFETLMRSKTGELIPIEVSAYYLEFDGKELDFSFSKNITERKQAEEALRRSELRFRRLFENSQVGIVLTRIEDGLILDANQKFLELTGYSSPDRVIKKKYTTDFYIHQSDRQTAVNQVLQNGQINNYEVQFRRCDGTTLWLLCSVRLNVEENCLEGVVTDITDRKQSEEALRRSELKYRHIFENSLVGIGRSRLSDGLFIDANQPCAEIIGYQSAQELIGKRRAGEFHVNPNDRTWMISQMEQNGELRNFEIQLYRQDGGISWGLFSARINAEESCLEFMIVDISDRKRLEEEVKQSQQFLNSIINNIPLGLFAKDVNNDFRYVLINKNSEKILGFSKEQGLGLNDYELIPQASADFFRQQDLTVVEQGTLLEVPEMEIATANQEKILSRILKFPLFDSQNRITHLLCISEDITDRKHREQALRLIVEGTAAKTGDEFFNTCVRYLASVLRVRYSLVTEFANETKTKVRTLAIWTENRLGENFEYNLQGTPCESILSGRTCYYPENLPKLFPKDGDLVTISAESYLGIPLTNSSGEILGHLAVMDVKPMTNDPGRELILRIFAARTGAELERKQAEEALESRAKRESLVSCISRQFIDQELNTALNFTLKAIAHFLGVERSCIFELSEDQKQISLIGEWCAQGIQPLANYLRLSNPNTLPWFSSNIFHGELIQVSSISDLPPEATAERAMLQTQSIKSLIVAPLIHSSKVIGFLGADVVKFTKNWSEDDISLLKLVGEITAIGIARHKAEEALRVAKEAAEAANTAKSTFLANMSHELRTPLNAILGFAQLMERDAALTARQKASLATINRSGEHLLTLINDVLEMSKIEAGRTVLHSIPFDLHRLLQTLQEMFQARAEAKQLSLEFDIATNLPQYVFTDEGKLRQVLINLLSNAVKFTETGKVSLRASANPINQELSERNKHDQITLYFEVQDTGRGIAPEEIDNLFQPFVQTTSGAQAREGTGLGLTISRQFTRLMGGDIYVKSILGVGSTFSFDIKIALAESSEVAPLSTNRRVLKIAPNQPNYRILVVDDRSENRDIIAQLLGSIGFEVRTANNGQEAIACWENWQPHLIWMDMRMPIMDGYEATRQIRNKANNSSIFTKIIALTASAFEEQRTTIITAGCDDLVSKPFREQVIFDKLTEHIGVRFIYAEESENQKAEETVVSGKDLKPSDLSVMPSEWLAELHQASLEVDAEKINQLITQIPPSHQLLIEGLTDLVRRFCFDEIYELTEN
ncbi:PAS domain S-box protein [Floridanema evergladense]|uniref:histidine kinase n=1 Tax=Floridaenema evergladense BLCC-F167 TaxID=3153639 RepID=A0ABV4WJQ7_9CYAN